jgi:hypothetical protein
LFQHSSKTSEIEEPLNIVLGSGIVDYHPYAAGVFFLKSAFSLKHRCRACQAAGINFFHENTFLTMVNFGLDAY